VKGRVEQTKGQAKETTGAVVGNKDLEEKGKRQKNLGKIQSGFGDLKENLKDNLKDKS
jgi:uncharacterized protein YjbJ (UPF0337 family)